MSTDSLRDILQAIYDERGDLTPALVVEAAAHSDHPLYHRFDWNDRTAGEKWRLEQAAHLIRSVRIRRVDAAGKPSDLRAFVAIKGEDTHRASYVPTESALADDFTRQLVLRDMEREWKSLKRRYDHMREFAALILDDLKGQAS